MATSWQGWASFLAKGLILIAAIHAAEVRAGGNFPGRTLLGARPTIQGSVMSQLEVQGCSQGSKFRLNQKVSAKRKPTRNDWIALLKGDQETVSFLFEAHREARLDCEEVGNQERANWHKKWANYLEKYVGLMALGAHVRFAGNSTSIESVTIKTCGSNDKKITHDHDGPLALKGQRTAESVQNALLSDPELAESAWKAHLDAARECKRSGETKQARHHSEWANHIRTVSLDKWLISCTDYVSPTASPESCKTALNGALKKFACGSNLVESCDQYPGTSRVVCRINDSHSTCRKFSTVEATCPPGYVRRNIQWNKRPKQVYQDLPIFFLCQIDNLTTRKNIDEWQYKPNPAGSGPADK